MEPKKLSEDQNRLLGNLEKVKQELSKNSSVLAVGVGIKESNNEFTGEVSYRVFVAEKKSLSDLSEQEIIPSHIESEKTDVLTPYVVSNRPGVCGDERRTLKKHRPLQAGIAISSDALTYGTLGWFGILDADDRRVLLTNKHVLYDVTNEVTTTQLKTAQPQLGSPSKCCCCECGSDNVVGESIIGIRNMAALTSTSVDCAISEINSDHASNISLNITNDSTSEVLTVSGTNAAIVGEAVRKIGARSGFTRGIVVHIGDTAVTGTDPAGGTITIRTGQVLVIPSPAETYEVDDSGTCKLAFSNNGDSGSVILNDDDEIVALLYGGDETTNSVDITFANNISNVLNALSTNSFITSLSTSAAGDGRRDLIHSGTKVKQSEINKLEKLRDDNRGSLLYKLYEKHHREVLGLINHNRIVTVTWHRNQGPAFVAALARSARVEEYMLPFEIEGISRVTLLTSMSKILARHGDIALKNDVLKYGQQMIDIFTENESIQDIAGKLKTDNFIDVLGDLEVSNTRIRSCKD